MSEKATVTIENEDGSRKCVFHAELQGQTLSARWEFLPDGIGDDEEPGLFSDLVGRFFATVHGLGEVED